MDPYLEDYLWPDFHQRLATEISRVLAPQLRPRYVARLAVQVVQDKQPGAEIGIMYPDVEILQRQQPVRPLPPRILVGETATAEPTKTISPALAFPLLDFEVRLVNVEVRDSATNQLVTSIEILSPVNKRGKELREYRRKRERLEAANVHLLEVDLLRRGRRPVLTSRIAQLEKLAKVHYLISLLRGGAHSLEVWAMQVTEPLPTVAVPLRHPDPDIALDLGACLATVYDEAMYDLSIDYTQKPPLPAFDEQTQHWIDALLRDYQPATNTTTDLGRN
jgi:hypothetical protein